jgi:hypothetical protein
MCDTMCDTMVSCCCGALQVYLHEIADPRYQALTGSLGYISLGIGVVIGILAVVMIVSLVHGGEATTAATCSCNMRTTASAASGPDKHTILFTS